MATPQRDDTTLRIREIANSYQGDTLPPMSRRGAARHGDATPIPADSTVAGMPLWVRITIILVPIVGGLIAQIVAAIAAATR